MIADLPRYAERKPSGVDWLGDVPQHWDIVPGRACLDEVYRSNSGMVESIVLSLSYGRIVIKPPEKLHGLVPASFETYQVIEPGDIIVRPTDLQNDWNTLRTAMSPHRGIITSAYMCLHTRGLLRPDFGDRLLRTYDLMKIFYGLGSGLRQNLSWDDFKYLPCLVPPPEEQAAIVRFLTEADRRINRLIRNKRRLIELLNEQKQAIITQAVTRGLDPSAPMKASGIEWLGDVPKHWKVWKIGHFAAVGNGSTPSRNNPSYWTGGMFPWLNSGSVHAGRIADADQFVTDLALRQCHLPRVVPGSILVAITGQGKTRGTTAILGIDATVSQHVAFITPRSKHCKITSEFLWVFLRAAYGELRRQSESSGSTKAALTCGDLRQFNVLVPPAEEQRTLVDWCAEATQDTEAAIATASREITLIQEYRTRLIADVVTGKLDVRAAAAGLPDPSDTVPEPADALNDDADLDAVEEELEEEVAS